MSKNSYRVGRGVYNAPVSYSRSCTSKRQYGTRAAAREAASRVRRADRLKGRGEPVDIYRCKVCSYLHVGHNSAR
jgi:rubrerythrin